MQKSLLTKYKILVAPEKKSAIMSLIISKNLSFVYSKITEDKRVEICIYGYVKNEYIKLLDENKISFEIKEYPGILRPIYELRFRFGLLLGIAILIIGINYSSKIVWKINVDGNVKVSNEEVINELSEAGFHLGTYIPKIDYDDLHNKVLLNSKKLSWISVNITGNVANVKVKEYKKFEESPTPLYSNIVAKSDGYIVDVSVLNGKKIVEVGDVVKKGDILIGGIIDSQSQGVRLENATGSVKAYVNKDIHIKIPLSFDKKIYTGKKYTNREYKIYNFPIKFSSKYGNQSSLYDTIEKKEQLNLFGISELPILTISLMHYEYIFQTVNLTISEAEEMANIRLREKLDIALSESELIDKSVSTYVDDNYFYLDCSLYCIEDIACIHEVFVLE